jgi:microcompartment protein CcmL/EutN
VLKGGLRKVGDGVCVEVGGDVAECEAAVGCQAALNDGRGVKRRQTAAEAAGELLSPFLQ